MNSFFGEMKTHLLPEFADQLNSPTKQKVILVDCVKQGMVWGYKYIEKILPKL